MKDVLSKKLRFNPISRRILQSPGKLCDLKNDYYKIKEMNNNSFQGIKTPHFISTNEDQNRSLIFSDPQQKRLHKLIKIKHFSKYSNNYKAS